ncbi:hypothetical protein C8R43DRAFT_1047761 [Mycena crocata]|nr:hypothetical protein C8R43DRAFT_1047761 [Mycena crocata]
MPFRSAWSSASRSSSSSCFADMVSSSPTCLARRPLTSRSSCTCVPCSAVIWEFAVSSFSRSVRSVSAATDVCAAKSAVLAEAAARLVCETRSFSARVSCALESVAYASSRAEISCRAASRARCDSICSVTAARRCAWRVLAFVAAWTVIASAAALNASILLAISCRAASTLVSCVRSSMKRASRLSRSA